MRIPEIFSTPIYCGNVHADALISSEERNRRVREAAKSIEAKEEYSDDEIAALEVDEIVAAKVLAFADREG